MATDPNMATDPTMATGRPPAGRLTRGWAQIASPRPGRPLHPRPRRDSQSSAAGGIETRVIAM